MDSRRVIGLVSLALVTITVVGLLATGNDPEPASSQEASTATATATPTDLTTETPTAETGPDETSAPVDPLIPELPDRGPHPPLLGIEGWLQSDITSLDELQGKVVAVQFWTFGCSNCKATLPHMQDLYAKYGGADFEIVGVHAPEFDYERDPESIARAAEELGVSWPIALDGEKRSFRSWQEDRRFWPRLYLLDRDGHIRYDAIGEGRYDTIDAAVGALIAESP